VLISKADCPVEPSAHAPPKRVIARGGVLPHVTQIAEALFDEPFVVAPHEHPTMYEVFYVLEGTATYTVGAQVHEAGPGDLVIVPPATRHSIRVTTPPHRIFYWGLAVE
jgi:quercetin dioxygenase-like cupin family protein